MASSSSSSSFQNRIIPQVISAIITHHFSTNPSLLPSPHFRPLSSHLLQSILSSFPRFLSHSSLSESLCFYNWVESNCNFSHNEMTCREMGRVLVKTKAFRSLWSFLRENESLVTTATITALIKQLGEMGLDKIGLNMFYRMKQFHCKPDVQSYNTVISVLCQNDDFKKARFMLEQMELPGAKCKPDLYTYTILISHYCKHGLQTGCKKAIRRRIWEANRMFRRMVINGFQPDLITYNCLINGLCKTYRIERAHELFDEMLKREISPNRVTYNSFIRYYSTVNEAEKALNLLRQMIDKKHGQPSSSSYTPIIHSFIESGRLNEAKNILMEMVKRGHLPREFTYKLVCDSLRNNGIDGFSEEFCEKIESGINERFRNVIRVKAEFNGRFRV
ncbi:hypothetical protein LUZ60_006095 [Juncus effusus]|nr:hypothetical protein LUZ60_006095 [Juncus effusus]